jgi:hypothetical protein
MKPAQIASVLNATIEKEITGQVDLIQEDLSNIVDVGKIVSTSLTAAGQVNSFVQTLIDRVGKVKYVDRIYRSQAPNIVKDSFEYGSILMKVRAEVPDFQENTSWKLGDLDGYGIRDKEELDPFVISAPNATQQVYNSRITFEAPITIGEIQLKQAFTSASEMGRFIAMIENRIQLKMTLATDALIMRTINNLIGLKIGASSANVVNILALYNAAVGAGNTLTAEQALRSTEFLRYATKTIALYKDYLKSASTKYNEGDYLTFTPEDRLKFVVLSEFAKDMETYLYADTYHNEFVKMDGYSTVPYWQSQGDGVDDYNIRSGLDIKCTDGTNTYTVVQSGIVGVMFDEEAAAVVNENYRTTAQYNARGEYTNYFYKWDAGYMNDTYENCIVFLVADSVSPISADYEAITSTELAGYKEINPKAAGWYTRSGAGSEASPYVYTLTTDTAPVAGTTYYRAVAAVPSN